MRRQAVAVMRSEVAVSERRACGLMGIHRATCRYQVRRRDDPQLRQRLRELAAERRRFGYRRLSVMLRREGWKANHKRVYRLYLEEKLSLRRKRGRRRRAGSRLQLPPPNDYGRRVFEGDAAIVVIGIAKRGEISRLRSCIQCGSWLFASANTSHNARKFCKEACRLKYFHQRNRKMS